tara:strand:+ start:22527 stop:23168 length:642 start_codon:yes stop_codon:yes gene_type:complete
MNRKILLVDDHPLFRRGVKELILSQCELYDDVAEADSGRDALDQMDRFEPGCVMLDIAMPGIDGLETLEIIKGQRPETQCIILSMYNNPEFVVDALNKGAKGYILKTDPDQVILECLHSIGKGGVYISTSISQNVEPMVHQAQIPQENIDALSRREKEVLALIAKNQTSKEISMHLFISIRTVQNHRVNICRKLGIGGPNALLKLAIENQAWL